MERGSETQGELPRLHVPVDPPPNTSIHPDFLEAFSEFATLYRKKTITFANILDHWTQEKYVHLLDTKYDHDIYLYYLASRFTTFGLWNEMADLLVMGSFFHQVRDSGIDTLRNLADPADESHYPIFSEGSGMKREKEAVENFLAKYLPKSCLESPATHADGTKENFYSNDRTPTSKQRIVTRYNEYLTGVELKPEQLKRMSMKQLIKQMARETRASLKSVRILLNDTPVLLSEIGHKTAKDMNVKDGDVIDFVDRCDDTTSSTSAPSKASTGKKNRSKKKARINKKKKMNRPRAPQGRVKKEENSEKYRLDHSRKLSIVFEEAESKFKAIRTNLNNLTLKKTQPKSNKLRRKKVESEEQVCPDDSQVSSSDSDGIGGKAGKIAYVVKIGEVAHLYKSGKRNRLPKNNCPVSHEIDLHKMTKDDARQILDKNLPLWVRGAMEGSYPWVETVRIVCGGGNQILSDLVRDWIKENDCVANAF